MSIKMPRHILAEALAVHTMQMTDANLLAREIAAYLLAERRVNELESILRDIMQYRAEHGVLEAVVVTAHDAPTSVPREVEQLLSRAYPKAKNIRITNRQDSSTIGGLRIDMANERLDMTIKTKLSTFKRLTAGATN